LNKGLQGRKEKGQSDLPRFDGCFGEKGVLVSMAYLQRERDKGEQKVEEGNKDLTSEAPLISSSFKVFSMPRHHHVLRHDNRKI
jgi:hypothetical protein